MRFQLLLIALFATTHAVIINEKPKNKSKAPKQSKEVNKSCFNYIDDKDTFTICEHQTNPLEITFTPPWAKNKTEKEGGKKEEKEPEEKKKLVEDVANIL